MTLGERIQELRKRQGLSQEALGEALGVSRQAISKWEADAAIPEVDKLIALSRLFGVTVGALLGVEEPAGTAADLSDRELRVVEEVAGRYAEALGGHPAPPPRWKRWIWPAVAAVLAAALLAGWVSLSGRIAALEGRYGGLQSVLSGLESTVRNQAGSVAAQVQDLLDQQNNLIADWSYSVADIQPQAGTGTLAVSLTPRQYVQGMTACVTAVLDDGTRYAGEAVPAEGPAPAFSAALALPLADEAACDVALSVTLTRWETSETQALGHLCDLRYSSLLALGADFGGVSSASATSIQWTGEIHVTIAAALSPALYAGLADGLFPAAAELRWYVDGEPAETLPLELPPWDRDTLSAALTVPLAHTLVTGKAEQVDFVLRVTDGYGLAQEYLIDRWLPGGTGQWEPDRQGGHTMLDAPIQP